MNRMTLEIPAAFAAEDVRLSARLPLNFREFLPPLGSGAIIHSEQRQEASIFSPELLTTYLVLLAVLMCGTVAVWLTFRWYHSLNQQPSAANEALAELRRALEEQEELDAMEAERIRAAIERRKMGNEPGTNELSP
jgi:hypothetical protein